ncbi:Signal peptide, CUB and EGF-like domain-containing protein 2,Fibrillin-2,Matrilin-2,Multiple epidermal growth factor-like domains protein 6 [Mytilus coruscus]|uniref:Signal peptide, CUB and EGF-like domain-containing protein 2,Fibrillin-2,Matrilin-2,Multiple epidermal growth factor-like domains protein 6 n=1 Tax=Mytilus coruscus TaxID=42192 RepID=A0A6J8AQW9_MYTCO|nr:Signal peptide, CUB and EGF-like domain-containing protein 2,Fibrillin-2,Matrilin-2,Multiple epidermal growth factor-like domains protein 6 [Mytilus coruscus]
MGIAVNVIHRNVDYLIGKDVEDIALCYGSTSCPNGGACASPNRCVCRPGFTGSKCSDLNECAAGTHNCQQVCINNHGSFACTCKSGFLMNGDKKTCTDIDECLENNGGCSEFCQNTDGSYKCSCKNGLYLASDEKTCIDTDECSINNGGCQHQCINDYTTFRCACNQGYSVDLDGKSCVDIDECAGPNKCSQHCENTVGLYNCSCYPGFELSDDGVTCLGDSDVPSVFQKYQIARRLLPRGCMFVSLMSCKGSETNLNLMLTSTDMWYRLNTNQSILYTNGIVFAEVDDISVPISLTGMNVISTGKNFDIVIGSITYREEDGTALKDRHYHDCSLLSLTPKIFMILFHLVPFWEPFSIEFKTSFHLGYDFQNQVSDCYRFGTEMSFSIYGDRIQVPAPLQGEKFCMIIDICHNIGGTIFLMIPEKLRNLLDKADYFIALAKKGIRLRPKGIGLSLVNEIKVNYKTSELNLWSGEEMFRYRVFQAASVWISTEVDYTMSSKNFDIDVFANVDVYLKIPSIKNLLLDLFVEEWNGLVQFKKLRAIPIVKFKVVEFEVVLSFMDIVLDSLEVFLSIGGGGDRVFCGNNANPPGIFATFLVNVNPFRNIPIIGEWMFDLNSQVYALLTTDKKLSIETKTDIVKEMTGLKEMLDKFRIVVDELYNKTIGELSPVLQQTIIRFQSSVLELQTILVK